MNEWSGKYKFRIEKNHMGNSYLSLGAYGVLNSGEAYIVIMIWQYCFIIGRMREYPFGDEE